MRRRLVSDKLLYTRGESMNKAIEWAKGVWRSAQAFWRTLPPWLQGTIVAFVAAVSASLGAAPSCWHFNCLKHTMGAAITAGGIAGKAFFMRAGPGPHPGETPYTGS